MAHALAAQLAIKIVGHLKANNFVAGAHLGTQSLADLFQVSRIPVTSALNLLAKEGFAVAHRNRGFFLARDAADLPEIEDPNAELNTPGKDPLYYKLAEDWLAGKITERVSENELMRVYDVSRTRLLKILQRAAEDLWAERLPGHGWRFHAVMVSPQAYEDGYRFRMVIEPAALLEPTFKAGPAALRELADQQVYLLKGGIRRLSRTELFSMNSQFHEVLIGFSNNPFFLDAVKKIDRVRRLLDFRSTGDTNRDRLVKQCSEHLEIIDLLENGDNRGAAELLRNHIKEALESKIDLVVQSTTSATDSPAEEAGDRSLAQQEILA